jgi:hypothetical protein
MAVAEVVGSEIAERHATIRFTNPDRPVRTLAPVALTERI